MLYFVTLCLIYVIQLFYLNINISCPISGIVLSCHMDEFNYENASRFLLECRETGKRSESARQVMLRLAPQIRELGKYGYTQKEVHKMLVQKYGLDLSFSTFRGYLRQAALNEEPKDHEDREVKRKMGKG